MKVQAVAALKAHHSLAVLLELAKLPRSTFYDHWARLHRPDRHAELTKQIQQAFVEARGAYGHRRIRAMLLRRGVLVSKKTVLKLMRRLGLRCQVRRRKRYNSFRGELGKAAGNILAREFKTETRHTKWATDVTEFRVGESKAYLSLIMDLHDNRVISGRAGPSPSVKMVTDGLRAAIDCLSPEERPIVHSDQGLQYRHSLWQKTLHDAGLTQSMSRRGNCLDNAVIEGFFGHLKEEWFRIQAPQTLPEFYAGLDEYLVWWNTTRIQERLGNLSPDEYRKLQSATG